MDKFNRGFEGDAKFGYGFEAAITAYKSLSWWERLWGAPLGEINFDARDSTCTVDYRD